MPQTLLGIDIGSYSVKIAEIERSFKGFEFVNFYERRIAYNELLKAEESVAVTLQGMIDDFGLRWDQVICGYPGHKVTARYLSLPFGGLKKISQTLEFELEGYVPFDLEGLVIDYHILNSTKNSSEMLVFYTLKEEFAGWLQLLQNCKVDPKVAAVEGVEFLNLVCLGMVPPDGAYCVLDIGHAKTNLMIARGKTLTFVRSLNLGGKNITQSVQKALGVPPEEAERLKIEMGEILSEEGSQAHDDLSRQVCEKIKERVDELVLQIKQVFFAYQDQMKESVAGIYLCGGTSRIPGLDRYLSSRLKQNVSHIDCTAFPFSRLGKVASHRAVMVPGLALALRGVAQARMPAVDLRQGEFAFKGDIQKLGGSLRHVGISVGLILLLGLSYFGVKHYIFSKQLDLLNGEAAEMVQKVLPKVEEKDIATPAKALKLLQTRKGVMEKRAAKLSEIEGFGVLDMLKEISVKVPARKDIRLDIEDFSLKDGRISLAGKADSFIAVDKIKTALENSGYFEGVTPGSTRKGLSELEYKFEMTMNVTGLQTKQAPKGKEKGKGKGKDKPKTPAPKGEEI